MELPNIFPDLVIPVEPKALTIGVVSEHDLGITAIKISGDRRTGKTVFAEVLASALESIGAEVTVHDGPRNTHDRLGVSSFPFAGKKVTIIVEQA
jgi:hypothetical protein